LELFECIADGEWSRFGFVWIFTISPFVGSIGALMIGNKFYKKFYDWKLKFDL
jgi:glycerol uptake facilitator-like aquaporin